MKSNKQKRTEEKFGMMLMLLGIFMVVGEVAFPLHELHDITRTVFSIAIFIWGAVMWMGENG